MFGISSTFGAPAFGQAYFGEQEAVYSWTDTKPIGLRVVE